MRYLSHVLLILLLLIVSSEATFSQVVNTQNDIKYKAWFESMDGSLKQKGFLVELKDSSIVFGTQQNLEDIAVSNLQLLKFRKKNAIGKSLGYGALIGFGIGGLIGLASGDDKSGFIRFTAEAKALGLGIIMSIPGAIVGATMGAPKVSIPIQGDLDTYNRQKEKLRKYSLMDR